MALQQSGLYTEFSAQQAAMAMAAAAAAKSQSHSSTTTTSRLPVNLSSLTPVPRNQLNLEGGSSGGGISGRGPSMEHEQTMDTNVKEAAMMQVRRESVL